LGLPTKLAVGIIIKNKYKLEGLDDLFY